MKTLPDSDDRFRSLVQYASDIITTLEVNGTILYESPALERLLGYRAEELIGTNAFNYIHPDDVEQVSCVFAQTLKTGGGRTTRGVSIPARRWLLAAPRSGRQ
jgi:PAS domain S-box-containing protein